MEGPQWGQQHAFEVQLEVGMGGQKLVDELLVFFGFEAAGAVEENPAGGQERSGGADDGALELNE